MIVERRFKAMQVLMGVVAATLQGAGLAAAQTAPAERPGYALSVTRDEPRYVTLKAKDAKLADVAADLGRQFAAKVIVGASLKDTTITADFAGNPIEPAALVLAPRVYIDYEVRQNVPPRPMGIYLLGNDDPDPALSAVIQGSSQGLLVQGHTEETGKPDPNAPLRIHYDKGRLSVFAKQQPLILVVMAVAEELGVPAEIKHESLQPIDVDIKDTPAIEEAFASFGENVRVYVRSNPMRVERTLLRVVVVPPAPK